MIGMELATHRSVSPRKNPKLASGISLGTINRATLVAALRPTSPSGCLKPPKEEKAI
jgi:hypothetical protein